MDRFIRRSPRFLLWQDIQDIIGPANKWPRSIRKNFWNQNIKHFDRILLAAFVFVNALNPVVFLEWGIMNNLFRFKDSRYRHFKIQDIDILKLYLFKLNFCKKFKFFF